MKQPNRWSNKQQMSKLVQRKDKSRGGGDSDHIDSSLVENGQIRG
jgi:hypothetical protein